MKHEPRYASFTEVQALSELVTSLSDGLVTLSRNIEAMRKKVYREDQAIQAEQISKVALPRSYPPGYTPTPEELNQMLGR